MNIKFSFLFVVLVVLFSLGTVSASDNATLDDDMMSYENNVSVSGNDLSQDAVESSDVDYNSVGMDSSYNSSRELDSDVGSSESNDGGFFINTVVNSTFFNYFDETGVLRSNVNFNNLIFVGNFSGLGVSTITVNKMINIVGKNATFDGVGFNIVADGVCLSGMNINTDGIATAVEIFGNNVTLTDNTFRFINSTRGIFAHDVDFLTVSSNNILFYSETNGAGIYLANLNNAGIVNNYIVTSMSSGCVVSCDDVSNLNIVDNDIFGEYNVVSGVNDVIYALNVNGGDNSVIRNNSVLLNGWGYTHAIRLNGTKFSLCNNDILATSDNSSVIGIKLEDVSGVVVNNSVSVKSPVSAYGIYSGCVSNNISYSFNSIVCNSTDVCGVYAGGNDEKLLGNVIDVSGDCSVGVVSSSNNLVLNGDNITAYGYNINVTSTDVAGVNIVSGNATIGGCSVVSNSNFTILNHGFTTLINNTLIDMYPSRVKIIVNDFVKMYGTADVFNAVLVDGRDNPISGVNVTFTINGVNYIKTTDKNGVASLNINLHPGSFNMTVDYDDFSAYACVNISSISACDLVKTFQNATQFVATFYDNNGKLLDEGTLVSFKVNGVSYKRVVDENGVSKLNINLRPGNYVLTAINPVNFEVSNFNICVLSSIESGDLVKTYKNASQFVVKVFNKNASLVSNGSVCFNVNGVLYTRDIVDGSARLNINLLPGKYVITTVYDGLAIGNNIVVKSKSLLNTSAQSKTFTELSEIIKNSSGTLELNNDYKYDVLSDRNFKGIVLNNANLTINGNNHTIDGDSRVSLFNITGGSVTLLNISFVNFKGDYGSVINAKNCVLNISQCSFDGNSYISYIKKTKINRISYKSESVYSNSWGGAIYLDGVNASISSSAFYNNIARYGGAIYTGNSILTLAGNIFGFNTAHGSGDDKASALLLNKRYGGAIYSSNSKIISSVNSFCNNDAYCGGAIYICKDSYNTSFIMDTFANNKGRAIYSSAEDVKVVYSNFVNNTAVLSNLGNSIYVDGGSLISQNNVFNNESDAVASWFDVYGKCTFLSLNVQNNTVTVNNTTKVDGNSIHITKSMRVGENSFMVENYYAHRDLQAMLNEGIVDKFASVNQTRNALALSSLISDIADLEDKIMTDVQEGNHTTAFTFVIDVHNDGELSDACKLAANPYYNNQKITYLIVNLEANHVFNVVASSKGSIFNVAVTNLVLNGNNAKFNVVNFNERYEYHFMYINGNVNVVITSLNMSGFNTAIENHGTLLIKDCNFINNKLNYIRDEDRGGAIKNYGQVIGENCSFIGNYAKYGGAIYNLNQLYLVNCFFSDNVGYGDGNDIFSCKGANSTIVNTTGTIYTDGDSGLSNFARWAIRIAAGVLIAAGVVALNLIPGIGTGLAWIIGVSGVVIIGGGEYAIEACFDKEFSFTKLLITLAIYGGIALATAAIAHLALNYFTLQGHYTVQAMLTESGTFEFVEHYVEGIFIEYGPVISICAAWVTGLGVAGGLYGYFTSSSDDTNTSDQQNNTNDNTKNMMMGTLKNDKLDYNHYWDLRPARLTRS